MHYIFTQFKAFFAELVFKPALTVVPLTDAGENGLCYYHRDEINWEGIGAVTGIIGAFLLAINMGYQGYGWLAFFASNLCWICFAILNRFRMLFWQQIAFLMSTMIGLHNTFGV